MTNGQPGEARQAPRDFRFADAGGADHQNIFGKNVFRHFGRELLPPHAVAQRHGHGALGRGLSDDVLVELNDDFARSQLVKRRLDRGFRLVLFTGKIDHHKLCFTPPKFVAPAILVAQPLLVVWFWLMPAAVD